MSRPSLDGPQIVDYGQKMLAEQIAQVRRFNRLVTQRAGALNDHFLGRDRSLGESRLLYEIGLDGGDLRDPRQRLGLDSGYVSRLVKALEEKGLVELGPGAADRRGRGAPVTPAGPRGGPARRHTPH